MLKELVTIAKSKIWFATVNKVRLAKAKRDLEAYTKTLSPKNQEWARELRARLDASPNESVRILRHEIDEVNVKHARLQEKLHAVTLVTDSAS